MLKGPFHRRPSQVPSALIVAGFFELSEPIKQKKKQSPCSADVFHVTAIFLQLRQLFPAILQKHEGTGSLLLTPRLAIPVQRTLAQENLTGLDILTLKKSRSEGERHLPSVVGGVGVCRGSGLACFSHVADVGGVCAGAAAGLVERAPASHYPEVHARSEFTKNFKVGGCWGSAA